MLDFTSSVIALKQILFERKSFNDVLFHTFLMEKLSRQGKKNVRDIVLGVLRHHNTLVFEAMNLFHHNKKSEEILLVIAALYEARYLKILSKEDLSLTYEETIRRLRLDNVATEAEVIFENAKKPFHIPEEVKESPFLYDALVLETPEFLLKKFAKDYSPKDSISIALSLHQKSKDFFGLDERIGDRDSLISDDGFTSIELSDKTLLFKSDRALSSSEAKAKGLYPLGYLEALAYSKVSLPQVSPKVLLIGCTTQSVAINLGLRTRDSFEAEVISVYEKADKYRLAIDALKRFSLSKNVKPLLTTPELVKTYLSYDCYDLAVCFGKSTDIGLSRRKPEILPSLEEKDFAKNFTLALHDLKETSEFVKNGGKLLFLSHGLVKDETKKVVRKFLSDMPSFAMVEEAFILPNMMDSDGGYYAILEKQHD